MRADFALIAARQADYIGNLEYSLTAQNFNPIMALAADTVIAEPEQIVPVGVIPPDDVKTPAVLVDHLHGALASRSACMDPKEVIARRVAREIKPGMLVNLGIGLPSLVANYLPR